MPQIETVITILGEMYFAVTSQVKTILAISLRRHFSFVSKRIKLDKDDLHHYINPTFKPLISQRLTHFYIPIISVKLYTDLCLDPQGRDVRMEVWLMS